MSRNKSVQKRIRQAEKRRDYNRQYKTLMKTKIKKVKKAQTKKEAEPLLKEAVAAIDKVAGKGIIHKNKAANQKSKLSKYVSKLS